MEEEGGKEGHPYRHGKLDGEDIGQGDEGDGVKPSELSGKMGDIAQQVPCGVLGSNLGPARAEEKGRDDDQADDTSKEEDLEGTQLLGELPS